MPVTKIMQTKIYSGCKKIDKCYCYAITARVIALLNHVKISPAFLYTRVDTEILLNTDIFAEDFGDRTFFLWKFLIISFLRIQTTYYFGCQELLNSVVHTFSTKRNAMSPWCDLFNWSRKCYGSLVLHSFKKNFQYFNKFGGNRLKCKRK